MQVYKYMDIGTAKPTTEEMSGIKHHMIDVVLPDCRFSVAKYKEMACENIDDVLNRKKLPILVGGTGLYVNSLIYNINYKESECDLEYRKKLHQEAKQYGNNYIYEKLRDIDRESYDRIHCNDLKRIIRALEFYHINNETITSSAKKSRGIKKYDYIIFGLNMDREKLYDRINKRVDLMLEKGLVDEVKKIKYLGYEHSLTASKAIGYKEIFDWLNGKCDYEEAVDKIKMESRRYAKRQITWFKRTENIHWIDMENDFWNVLNEVLNTIENF